MGMYKTLRHDGLDLDNKNGHKNYYGSKQHTETNSKVSFATYPEMNEFKFSMSLYSMLGDSIKFLWHRSQDSY